MKKSDELLKEGKGAMKAAKGASNNIETIMQPGANIVKGFNNAIDQIKDVIKKWM